jgi:integrase
VATSAGIRWRNESDSGGEIAGLGRKNGVRQRDSGFLTKQAARMAEAEARKNLKQMNSDFIALCESRLKDLKSRRTDQYFKENKSLVEKLIVRWKAKKGIFRKDIEDYLSEQAQQSNPLANRDLRMIKALFSHGVDREMLDKNPAERIKFFPVDKKQKYVPPKEDIEKVLSVATPRQANYLLAIIHSLARVNEINKLKREDVFADYIILWTRKSKDGSRVGRKIPKNETLKASIDAMPEVGEYVYCYKKTGKPYHYRSKMMHALCKKAKVKEFTYHALRHYGASRLAEAGVSLTDIQYLLGHQRATTTDIYLHSISHNLRDAMSTLDIKSPI